MSTGTTLILACALAVGASAATTALVGAPSAGTERSAAAAAPAGDAAGASEVAELARRVETLGASVEALRSELATVAPAERVPIGEIQNAVDRWMAEHAGEADPGGSAGRAGEDEPATSGRALDEILADLDEASSGEDWDRLWKEIRANGQMDEAIALFEAHVEDDPTNPDAHVEVASAYLAKTQEVGPGPEAGLWATKADQAFDRALELDDHHWQARFSKATALSFWPPLFGKQGEAIRNFEILLDQQKSLPPQPEFAETYLFLGNLYQQTGKGDEAMEMWKGGLALYPDSKGLAEKLKALGQ